MDFHDKVVLVTGASRGIGRRLCADLAAAGHDVVCVARSSRASPGKLPGTVEDAAADVEASGRRAMVAAFDVRDEKAIEALTARIYDEWGRCDLLVNNAAVAPPLPALTDSTRRWRLAVDVNLNAPFYLTYYVGRRMLEAEGGRVVNISSGAAVSPQFGRASYTATKRALEGLTEALAYDLRGKVAVNCIRIDAAVWSEGFTETLGEGDYSHFEDPVIVSDAVSWLAGQPISYSGKVVTISELREMGAVRPKTPIGPVTSSGPR